jgi:hypothetical protein
MSETDKGETPTTKDPFGGIGQFIIKTCIVAIVISASSIFVVDWIIDSLEDSTGRTLANFQAQAAHTTIGGRQFWTKIENELDSVADPSSDLAPEKKQKLINDVRVIVARWRPFIDAAQNEMQKPPRAN